MKKIQSIGELNRLASTDDKYLKLAIAAANNLGGNVKNLTQAIHWLNVNASETDEEGVIDEINFCIPLVK